MRELAEGNIGTPQKPGVGNRIGKADIEKGSEETKFVSEMIVPVKSHAAGAQSFRRTRRGSRTIQARAEIEGRPFSRISETYVGITMPAAEVVPVFEEDGRMNRYGTPTSIEKCSLKM